MEDLYSIMSSIYEFLQTLSLPMLSLAVVVILCTVGAYVINGRRHVGAATGSGNDAVVPQSVNYHFTRQCNYKCGFCFHTAKTSFLLGIEDAKRGLKLLKNAGDVAVVCFSYYVCLSVCLSVTLQDIRVCFSFDCSHTMDIGFFVFVSVDFPVVFDFHGFKFRFHL